jgi:hypothetical protein
LSRRGCGSGLTGRHGHQAFCCEYGIRCHGKESVRRSFSCGLSESCGQSEIAELVLSVGSKGVRS